MTISTDEDGEPFEVFGTLGKAGSFEGGVTELACRLVSLHLRRGTPLAEIVDQIRGIHEMQPWPNQLNDGTTVFVHGLGDAIAHVLKGFLKSGRGGGGNRSEARRMSRTNNGEIAGKRGCLMGRPRSYVRKEDEAMEQNEQDPPRNGVYSRPSAYFDGDGTLVVRASAAAGCRRALWYAATEHEPTNPTTDEALTVMEAGTALEPVVLRAMERANWDVIPTDPQAPQTVAFQIAPNLKVTGHPDATGVLPLFGGDEVIVEVKTRGPSAYRRWQVLGAERSHPESVAQLALYTYGKYREPRDGVIATMDTGSREWDVEVIPADRVEVALERVRSWLGELADRYDAERPRPRRAAGEGLPRRRLALPVLSVPEHLPSR